LHSKNGDKKNYYIHPRVPWFQPTENRKYTHTYTTLSPSFSKGIKQNKGDFLGSPYSFTKQKHRQQEGFKLAA
jgi:hypothetical protein